MEAPQAKRVFLLSSDAFTTDITQTIQQLGGVVIDSRKCSFFLSLIRSTFDARATHFITASLKRTEKAFGRRGMRAVGAETGVHREVQE